MFSGQDEISLLEVFAFQMSRPKDCVHAITEKISTIQEFLSCPYTEQGEKCLVNVQYKGSVVWPGFCSNPTSKIELSERLTRIPQSQSL